MTAAAPRLATPPGRLIRILERDCRGIKHADFNPDTPALPTRFLTRQKIETQNILKEGARVQSVSIAFCVIVTSSKFCREETLFRVACFWSKDVKPASSRGGCQPKLVLVAKKCWAGGSKPTGQGGHFPAIALFEKSYTRPGV